MPLVLPWLDSRAFPRGDPSTLCVPPMRDATPSQLRTSSAKEPDPTKESSSWRPGRSELTALYQRVADTLERSAKLAEQHADREQRNGRRRAADIELERAKRARAAAQRGRGHATRLK